MATWADFLKENRMPSNPQSPSSSGLRKKNPSPEEVNNAKLYFERLQQLMKYEVAIGELTPEIAQQIIGVARNTPEDKIFTDAPYASDLIGTVDKQGNKSVIPDWQWKLQTANQQADLVKYQQEKQKDAIKLQSTKNSYLPQFKEYLAEAVSRKVITPEQADQYYKVEESQLDLGVSPKDLANYQGVQDFTKIQGKVEPTKKYGDTGKTQTQSERQYEQESLAAPFAQLFEQQAKQNNQKSEQDTLDMKLAQGQAQQRSAAISRPTDTQSEAQQRAELFRQFETVKQQKLSSLDPEMDWVQRWFVQHEENPYTPPTPTTQDRIDALGGELQKWQSIGQNYPDAPVNVGDSVTWGQVADQSKERIMAMLEDIKNAPPDSSDSVTARQTAPATPDWLAGLVPGLKTGQPIRSNVEIPTPSLQQWSRTAPSIQNQYAGFSNWAGVPIKDTLARMNLMRPETPRGAGNFGFNPSRQ